MDLNWWVFPAADALVAAGDTIARTLKGFPSVRNIPNGVELKKVDPGPFRYRLAPVVGTVAMLRRLPGEVSNHCAIMYSTPMVLWNGDLVPCCYDSHAKHILGNVFSRPFSEVWNGEKAVDFRRRVIRDRRSVELCNRCPEGRAKVVVQSGSKSE